MTPSMVTVNAGGSFSDASRWEGMLAWAEDAAQQQPLLVFAQEVPSPATRRLARSQVLDGAGS